MPGYLMPTQPSSPLLVTMKCENICGSSDAEQRIMAISLRHGELYVGNRDGYWPRSDNKLKLPLRAGVMAIIAVRSGECRPASTNFWHHEDSWVEAPEISQITLDKHNRMRSIYRYSSGSFNFWIVCFQVFLTLGLSTSLLC